MGWRAAVAPPRKFSRTISPGRSSPIPIDDAAAAAYDYELPAELIAHAPLERRDASRLMVLGGDSTQHRHFHDLPDLLRHDDLLVINETRVIAARLCGKRERDGGDVELLLLHPAGSLRYDPHARIWVALARPARRLRQGDRIVFGDQSEAIVRGVLAEGRREIEFAHGGTFEEFLTRAGRMPLPPYIHNESPGAQQRYQTVFARVPGSVAAPTASLHFTPEMLREIERRGIRLARICLDVGVGTFRPIASERLERHSMHAEAYEISPEAAAAIEAARRAGRRIVAVGTTVVRALEGNAAAFGTIAPGCHETDLFIRPGFSFEVVGAMITNFHLPRSTLLVLVSAFAGRDRILRAYTQAIERRYRFYSFGDAMLLETAAVLPSLVVDALAHR